MHLNAANFVAGDNRKLRVEFTTSEDGVRIAEVFEAKDEYPAQQQRQGRAAILNNFKQHLEGKCEATGPAG